MNQSKVALVADGTSYALLEGKAADLRKVAEGDFDTEWLSFTLGVKVVKDVDEAIAHMRKHNASHSDAILTNDIRSAERFVNAAAQQLFTSMPRRALLTVRNLVLVPRWLCRLRSCTPAVRWGWKS